MISLLASLAIWIYVTSEETENFKTTFRNVRIEVWDVPMQGSDKINRIVELSYETTDLEDAAADRDAFIRGLTQQGLLLQHDALKTQQVLDAFLGSTHSQA